MIASVTAPLLACSGLAKAYGRTQVLEGVDLELAAGESVAILGQSGSGKTTLLSILAGLEPPDRGQVICDGRDLYALDAEALTAWRGRSVGIVFQDFHLVPALTALENVALPLDIAGRAGSKAVAADLLARVGLGGRGGHYPHQLSGGEKQRVAMARALAPKPRILFADEPTGSLDEATARGVEDLMFDLLRAEGVAAVLITHNRALAERCGRVLRLHLGRLEGAPAAGARPG